jgi:hypothetical protein
MVGSFVEVTSRLHNKPDITSAFDGKEKNV